MENKEENVTDVQPNDEQKVVEEKSTEKKDVEGKKKKKTKIIIIIALILIVIIACAVYFVFFGNKKETKTIKNEVREVKNDYYMESNSLQKFDIAFMKLENNGKNQVYSPLSIKYALEMLSEGAKGETKAQLDAVIGKYKANKYTNSKNMSFANALFVRDTYKSNIKKDYTDLLVDKYNAELLYDSFSSPDNVNKWVSNKTFNLINNLMDDVSALDFILINALAIDMDWKNQIHCASGSKVGCMSHNIWYIHENFEENREGEDYSNTTYPYLSEEEFPRNKFEGQGKVRTADIAGDYNRYDIIKEQGEKHIRDVVRKAYTAYLNTPGGKEDVKLGNAEPNVDKYLDSFIEEIKSNYGKESTSTDFYLYEDDNVRSFAKDLKEYNGMTLQYIGIMPKEGKLTDYIDNMSVEDINGVIKNLKEAKLESFKEGVATQLYGYIPFFKFDSQLELIKDLQKLGITDVFDKDKVDLTNISKTGAVIGKAVHKANIDFSNDGIKAAAATAAGGLGSTGGGFNYSFKIPVEKVDVTFDRPFIYLIRDKNSGEVWFAGTVYDPVK